MEKTNNFEIFKKGSKTYFYSSYFFPIKKRQEVAILYAFVRTADNYVDATPQDEKAFTAFCAQFEKAWQEPVESNNIVDNFVILAKKKQIPKNWIDSFLSAMRSDLEDNVCHSYESSLNYIYGSAEVIGLMMAKIMELPEKSYEGAKLLGRSMQYINFIRDIQEDIELGRQYLPAEDLKNCSLADLTETSARNNPSGYNLFINQQLERYLDWQKQAEQYFKYIPKRYRLPIQTASSMYNYTAKVIASNPNIVFQKKVKPSKIRIILSGFHNAYKLIC